MDMRSLLEALANNESSSSSSSSSKPKPSSRNMQVASRRVHKMEKLRDDRKTTRFECQAALLSAQSELHTFWPVDHWNQKDEHLAFLDAAVTAFQAISQAATAVDVIAALDTALELEKGLADTRMRDVVRELLMRITHEVLVDLARKARLESTK